mmetsp:Transcript_37596/g.91227  ORF Transcript_37596/g.91227 Transcript_37596/m.91227 type:complete len:103 (+) Transcript_37596:1152-1460(+)
MAMQNCNMADFLLLQPAILCTGATTPTRVSLRGNWVFGYSGGCPISTWLAVSWSMKNTWLDEVFQAPDYITSGAKTERIINQMFRSARKEAETENCQFRSSM